MKKFIAGAASLMLCMGLHAQDFRINPSGYFENGGANVMVFSDVYPEGHQGGLTLVLNGDRRAANGDVRFEISQGQWQGLPKMRSRVVDEADNEIRVTLSYPDSAKHMAGFNPMLYPDFVFGYTIKVKGEKDYLVLTVDLDQPVPERFAGKLGFNLELVPSTALDWGFGPFPFAGQAVDYGQPDGSLSPPGDGAHHETVFQYGAYRRFQS